ncbi:MAG: hypothetical protein ABSE63_13180 [Thermoguttaceae bacterium]|jgi:hypothetical protein
MQSDPLSGEGFSALRPVVAELERLGVRYYIGGSVAGSSYGYSRMTQDVDVVAELRMEHVKPLVEALQQEYYVNAGTVADAVARRSCFNLIHNKTFYKVDIFASQNRDYNRAAFQRIRKKPLVNEDPTTEFFVASAEDVILSKLEWYRLGDEASDRQWTDILKILEVQKNRFDRDYMQKWAEELGIADILAKAWNEINNIQ